MLSKADSIQGSFDQREGSVLSFIKDHWLAYLIAAALAVALGLGAAYVVGVIGSTPDNAHTAEQAEQTA